MCPLSEVLLYIEINRAIDYGFANRLIIFILLNEPMFLQDVTTATPNICTCCNTLW